MTHPKEYILDLYALGAKTLDSAALSEVEGHLAGCATCRQWVEYLRHFYAAYEEIAARPPAGLEKFLNSILPPASVFELHPFRSASSAVSQARIVNTVLAAGTVPDVDARFRRLAVLASEEEGIVLRVIYDTSRSELQVYLVGGNPDRRRFAIVAFPLLNIDCVTDESGNGHVAIDPALPAVDWDNQYAQVHLPVDEIAVPESGTISHSVGQPARYSVTVQREQQHLHIDTRALPGASPPLSAAVVTSLDDQSELVHLSAGKTSITLPDHSARVSIRLYN